MCIDAICNRVDMSTDDMIWADLSLCGDVMLGGVCVPPADSLLYCEASPCYGRGVPASVKLL